MAESPVSNDMILGELRGQVRELVHSVNNIGGKVDALAREVIALGPLAADISEIKQRLTKLEETDGRGATPPPPTRFPKAIQTGAVT